MAARSNKPKVQPVVPDPETGTYVHMTPRDDEPVQPKRERTDLNPRDTHTSEDLRDYVIIITADENNWWAGRLSEINVQASAPGWGPLRLALQTALIEYQAHLKDRGK